MDIVPLTEQDLSLVHEIRNHEDTLKWLHNQQHFTFDQTVSWFHDTQPKWFLIKQDGIKIGYFRTSDWASSSVKIGADIHPNFRGKGHATQAYKLFIDQLRLKGIQRIWLEVLADNKRAISLYRKLGFKTEGRLQDAVKRSKYCVDSLIMALHHSPKIACVKIIATYFGDRRKPPYTAADCLPMIKKVWQCEKTINAGTAMDTVFICNTPRESDKVSNWDNVQKCTDFLTSLDQKKTKNGKCYVLKRDNQGVSFGAYNYGFKMLQNKYTHFFFTEDDHIMIKNGYYRTALKQLESQSNLGFVGVVKVYRAKGWKPCFAAGGIGFTTRRVLRQVERLHGRLPYAKHGSGITKADYVNQKRNGEYKFTGAIWEMGYDIDYINMEACCIPWGNNLMRTDRLASMDKLPS